MSSKASQLPPLKLSRNEANELLQILEEPLTGRPVLIPLGPYAFVPGRLDPHRGDDNDDNGNDNCDKEQSSELVTIQGKIPVTRTKAQEWLGGPGANHITTTSSSTTQQPRSTAPLAAAAAAAATVSPPTHGAAPFVEIHEEYDARGNPVRADVVDMNHRLEALWKLGDDDDTTDGESKLMDSTTNWLDTILQPPRQESANSTTTTEVFLEDEIPLKSLDDHEYDKLARRLEELARREEEEESAGTSRSSARANPQSFTKKANNGLGGGWKKGFLNAGSPKITPKTTNRRAPSIPSSDTTAMAVSTSTSTTTHSPTVQIDTAQNQVHEIPRIGTQKVPPRQPASVVSGMERPLEKSIFSGVIQERPDVGVERMVIPERDPVAAVKSSRFTAARQQQQQQQQQAANTPSLPVGQNKPQRMSRFAQERQGR